MMRRPNRLPDVTSPEATLRQRTHTQTDRSFFLSHRWSSVGQTLLANVLAKRLVPLSRVQGPRVQRPGLRVYLFRTHHTCRTSPVIEDRNMEQTDNAVCHVLTSKGVFM